MHNVAVFVGSLRAESINRKFAKALERLGKDRFAFNFVQLADLPMYNDDLWQSPPAPVLRLKADIEAADAVLIVTPEYNRGTTPLIVNAVAWGSRPKGKNSWAGKPASLIGTSGGGIGTAVAQSELRSQLVILGTVLMGQPEVYFQTKPGLIDDNHEVTDEKTRAFLDGYLSKFDAWIGRVGVKVQG
ncbi:MAG TPA: NAD(P)H-dependent oxidoreductase [Gemmatimonadaceae bacterium]|jgi:chromate reductase|nr:NAD(P)H-dependent oxidoreductase [Gemmatimonadaceae bacterium]